MLYGKIDLSTSGDNTLVTPPAGRRVRLVNYLIVSADVVSLTWKSGSTALSGAMPLIAQSVLAPPFPPDGGPAGQKALMETVAAGDTLILNLSASKQVSGHFCYELI